MEFQPYIIPLPLRPQRKFFVATKQAHDWYNPLDDTQTNELKWLQEHVDFGPGRKFLDAGCHHGYYILNLANGCEVMGVDVHMPNLAVCEVEMKLNGVQNVMLFNGGIAHETGWGYYDGNALGGLRAEGTKIPVMRPQDLYPEANIVKMDIEGAEYYTIPACIDYMPHVDTWIIELHLLMSEQVETDANKIVQMFRDRGYKAAWWDRAYLNSPLEVCQKVELNKQSTFLFFR